jgi:hypothetical protein
MSWLEWLFSLWYSLALDLSCHVSKASCGTFNCRDCSTCRACMGTVWQLQCGGCPATICAWSLVANTSGLCSPHRRHGMRQSDDAAIHRLQYCLATSPTESCLTVSRKAAVSTFSSLLPSGALDHVPPAVFTMFRAHAPAVGSLIAHVRSIRSRLSLLLTSSNDLYQAHCTHSVPSHFRIIRAAVR